ncbi:MULTISPECIES: helix-turn-helix domain-containing protein [unclassified Nocardia]|uniref:MmyB family transcriptional regulator n=1 Tax=unclassified Nocardia TaxID=2637762 RepID=UPI00278BC3C1|nr:MULTISPECIES: helix-turn-helix domain-containing protein [unclassified Nocardia]
MGAEFQMPTLGGYAKWLRNRRSWTQLQLAQRVRIGKSTYERIEQGATARYRDGVLEKLANVLCDNEHELAHWWALAGQPISALGEVTSPADIGALLDGLSPLPAAWIDNWRVAEANARHRELMPGLHEAETLPHWVFGDVRAKLVCPDWQREATIVTGLLRHYAVSHRGRGATPDVIASLMAYPEFRYLWESGIVYARRPEPNRRIWSPSTQTMTVVREAIIPTSAAGQLIVGFPADND